MEKEITVSENLSFLPAMEVLNTREALGILK